MLSHTIDFWHTSVFVGVHGKMNRHMKCELQFGLTNTIPNTFMYTEDDGMEAFRIQPHFEVFHQWILSKEVLNLNLRDLY